jgi:hypothetical protein
VPFGKSYVRLNHGLKSVLSESLKSEFYIHTLFTLYVVYLRPLLTFFYLIKFKKENIEISIGICRYFLTSGTHRYIRSIYRYNSIDTYRHKWIEMYHCVDISRWRYLDINRSTYIDRYRPIHREINRYNRSRNIDMYLSRYIDENRSIHNDVSI